jgi:ParB family chromosome partitioning protein
VSVKRDRLGRGLGALLGDYLGEQDAGEVAESPDMRRIPVSRVVPNPYQPRREFSDADLADLTASMRENGLLQPIVVRPAREDSGKWELVAGEQRWRASVRLGWPDIPALVRDVDDRTLLVLALVENIQRAELSPLEEAEAYRRLSEEFALSQKEIADTVGRDRSTVSNAMRLLQLPASVRSLIAEGRLSAGHARALLALNSDRRIGELAQQAADEGWSVRHVEQRVQSATGRKRQRKAPKPREAAERQLEDELQKVLGTAARIRRSKGMSGRIEIPFYGAEDFERVFELIAGRAPTEILD